MDSSNIRAQDESPGTVIKTYIIDGLGLGIQQLARALDVPANRLYQIINNKREVSIDTAVRLGYFLDMEHHFGSIFKHVIKLNVSKNLTMNLK